ncbi:MAG: hydroxymethylglutaryl-CoA reductase [Candidatus Omnitrophica bacterium]|nr:hydroxymethylglutaryl-CoA reductase [Candidatus Omnitrophota bacterium]
MSDLGLNNKKSCHHSKQGETTIPHNQNKNYDKSFVEERRKWIEEKTACNLKHISVYSEEEESMRGNIENLIGVCHIPLGVAGPVKINGEYAKGDFYVPLATTEGALVLTYNRGMRVLTKSGGANVRVLRDEMHISPAFYVENLIDAENFIKWIKTNFKEIKEIAETTTTHGKLLDIEPIIMSRLVVLKFSYYTEDAQGLNMINKASERACEFIKQETRKNYVLRSNYSSIKKAANSMIHKGQGKSVFVDALISKECLRLLGVSAKEMENYFKITQLSSIYGGMLHNNAHFANAIAAMFIACGQDVADISTSHIGISGCEVESEDSLYVSAYIPNLFVKTSARLLKLLQI